MAGSTTTATLSVFNSSPMLSARFLDNVKPLPSFEKRFSFTCYSSKKKKLSFVDQILDYIEGGPKLRKWYGAPDLVEKERDALNEYEASDEIRDAVFVTDGDNEIGQMVILSLLVKRIRVKALVKDKRAAIEAFGTYVEPLTGDVKNKTFLKKASKGVRAVICPTVSEGFLSNVDDWKGIEHVILLSQELHRYSSSHDKQCEKTR